MKIDYKKLGFKAGLEIHQQLDTNKLFCSCPSVLRSDSPDFVVERKLHAVSGESGDVDVAAKFQAGQDKKYFYEGYDTTCLVELDEEPPHSINQDALKIALEISLLLNCKVIPISQIMRKTVVNGSNTSGFQRTVVIARDGYIETSEGKVGVDSVYLEEDSARPVDKKGDSVTYRIDRLGIPLVEISTKPDLKNAKQVKEAALKIGEILRSCRVRRGIGTIRQDLNISVKGSNRVEIKGFQDPKIMKKCVDTEIERQDFLINMKKVKFSEPKIFDVTDFLSPELEWMKNSVSEGGRFVAFKLSNFSGMLGRKEDSNVWLGKEISSYVKSAGFGGVIHSDEEMEKYKFNEDEIKEIERKLGVKSVDAWCMLLGDKDKAFGVIKNLVFPFLKNLGNKNFEEVRNCVADGSTVFLRPMPGFARMYPETDLSLLHISRDFINDVKKTLPKLISEIEEDLRKKKLREDQIKILIRDRDLFSLFMSLYELMGNPTLVANMILDYSKDIASRFKVTLSEVREKLNEDVLAFVLESVYKEKIKVQDVRHVMEKIFSGVSLGDAIKLEKKDLLGVEEEILKIIKSKPGLTSKAYMGLVMKDMKGAISGKEVVEIINRLM